MRKKLNCSVQQPDIAAAGSPSSWNQSNLLDSLFPKPPETLEWTKVPGAKRKFPAWRSKRDVTFIYKERGDSEKEVNLGCLQALPGGFWKISASVVRATALITLMEEPWTMAAAWNPWSYCWCKCRGRAKTAVPNLSLTATTGPQGHSCFAPGKCGGETFRPAQSGKGGDAQGGKGEQKRWAMGTRGQEGAAWRRWGKSCSHQVDKRLPVGQLVWKRTERKML